MKFLFYLITIINLLMGYVSGSPDRIAGGKPIKKGEYEYFIQLLITKKFIQKPDGKYLSVGICGGSLIHPIWVLTAAHCFRGKSIVPPQMFADGWVRAYIESEKVVPGFSDKKSMSQYVEKALLHPKYIYQKLDVGANIQNDVAIAKLKKPFQKSVKPITLAGYRQTCNVGKIIGTGYVKLEGQRPELVQYCPVQIKTKDQISIKPHYTNAGGFYSEVRWFEGHPLKGDSGGPFICKDTGYSFQYGIISANIIWNKTGVVVSIYERVEHYISFIRQNVPFDYLHEKLHRVKKKHTNNTKHLEQENEIMQCNKFSKMKFLPYLITIINLLMDYVSGSPDRIAGGKPIEKGEYEFFVQLIIVEKAIEGPTGKYNYSGGGCGGSLIHPIWVLTAGHCFKRVRMIPPHMFAERWVLAYIGTERVVSSIFAGGFISQQVEMVQLHPKYSYRKISENRTDIQNDVAIAKLKEPFEISVDTITLPIDSYTRPCKLGIIIGAGVVNFEKENPKLVQYSPMRIKTKDQLSIQVNTGNRQVFYSEVGWFEGHPLQGDSGGPFICYDIGSGYPFQYGIISGDIISYASRVVVSVYERVEYYMSFIRQYVPLDYPHKKLHRVKKKHQNDTKHPEQEVKSGSVQIRSSFISICVNVILYLMRNFQNLSTVRM
ncbi:hypothetical protein ILUMI_20294 [Ignelater luminosus]|uniref:Peptidase S1 domain-containing protein n=1 Tax=Ignelater luminosus TaxID=2038154 RepID=A0A8K0CEJ4_IGNLU|nr:hypothetical protein ILUMI_20294 [Ignelater luminosus]